MSDKYAHHWPDIVSLARSDSPAAFEKLKKYALEGYLRPLPPHPFLHRLATNENNPQLPPLPRRLRHPPRRARRDDHHRRPAHRPRPGQLHPLPLLRQRLARRHRLPRPPRRRPRPPGLRLHPPRLGRARLPGAPGRHGGGGGDAAGLRARVRRRVAEGARRAGRHEEEDVQRGFPGVFGGGWWGVGELPGRVEGAVR